MSQRARHIEVKDKLLGEIETRKQANNLPVRGGFISRGFLNDVLTSSAIRELLQEDYPGTALDDAKFELLHKAISTNLKKTYALLLLLDAGHHILDLYDYRSNALSDENLFDSPSIYSGVSPRFGFPRDEEYISKELSESLIKQQWVVPPPLTNAIHQRFPVEDFRFPFDEQPQHFKSGAYGIICRVKISHGQLEFPEDFDQKTPLAMKTVWKEGSSRMSHKRLMNEVNTLRARKHRNIMSLIASFTAGDFQAQNEKERSECIYLIMPLAEGNLQDWIEYESIDLLDNHSRGEYISNLMLDIASGVAFVHSKDKESRIGFHHDIKPSNIVRYREYDAEVWKLCDFGGANLKDLRIEETNTSFQMATHRYAPLEYYDEKKRGRPADVWSLGCVLLELVTIWKYGWGQNGYTELKRHIDGDLNDSSGISAGSKDVTIEEGRKHANYCDNKSKIDQWIQRLGNDNNDTKRFGEVLDLLQELLQERPEHRILAWEVEIELFIIMRRSEPSQPWDSVIQRLEQIAQPSNQHSNAIMPRHNPLLRARKKNRPINFLAVIERKDWSDKYPGSTDEARRQSNEIVKWYSNLELQGNSEESYGRHTENAWIETEFSKASCIGLYGVYGVGKSHLAFHYAHQFNITTEIQAKKHTFWINAESMRTVETSYEDIASNIPLDRRFSNRMELFEDVKGWFENRNTGPWIIVVDGLNSTEMESDIMKLLPGTSHGQVLVTARTRETMSTICKGACLEIKPPALDASYNIFQYYLEPAYNDEDLEGTSELLETLWLPLVVKMAATYMNKKRKPIRSMRQDLEVYRFQQIAEFSHSERVNFMEYFLQPLTQQEKHSPEVKLLCFLACLSKERIGLKLVQANYEPDEHPSLDGNLSSLVNGAFIEKFNEDSFRMQNFVQEAVIAWIREKQTEQGLFELLSAVLGTIYVRYKEKKRAHDLDSTAISRHGLSYGLKLPFMEHFARFMEFKRTAKREKLLEFKFHERAIECIESFSHVFVDEGRLNEAIEVLEFALEYAELPHRSERTSAMSEEKTSSVIPNSNHLQEKLVQFKTEKTLAEAYSRRGEGEDYRRARMLLKGQLRYLEEIDRNNLATGRVKCKKMIWNLQIDLVDFYWKFGRLAKARKQLRSLHFLEVKVGQESIAFGSPGELRIFKNANESERKKIQYMSIRYLQFQGLLLAATGRAYAASKWPLLYWQANHKLAAARRKLARAAETLKQWLPDEEAYLMDIENSISDVDLELGTMPGSPHMEKCLSHAERVLERHVTILRRSSSEYRAWKAERKLAEVRIHRGSGNVQNIVSSLESIMTAYQTRPASYSTETSNCARILAIAYEKQGQHDQARKLREEHGLLPTDEREKPSRGFIPDDVFLMFISLLLFLNIIIAICLGVTAAVTFQVFLISLLLFRFPHHGNKLMSL
ncbi:unnamed protein product [Periconia digitata]|uniref:Protein kinase domain-containing protein n=1 Tax=Periconia digitata TaxID=1303443 RepID=A0A9W4XWG8_9PLEO|nr:unnamed protein product [Periconia digitata]